MIKKNKLNKRVLKTILLLLNFLRMRFILIFIIFNILSSLAISQENKDLIKKYDIKSGIVEYEIKGVTSGKETLYFEEWGSKTAKYTSTETNLGTNKIKNNTLTITDKNWIYEIDLETKSGTKQKNSESNKQQLNDRYIGEKEIKELKGVKSVNEKLLNKDCEVWEIKKLAAKIWIYKGIILQNTTKMAGMDVSQTAVKIQENVKISKKKFKIPKNLKITEVKNLFEDE